MTDLPLAGVKVLDLSRVLAGPLSAMVLADLGADVIKVEHPVRGDDTRDWGIRIGETETTYYYAFNRNKKSVALDLSTPEGAAAVRALAREADVVVENFRRGTLERFGLGYDDLRRQNPKLVGCSIAGYDRLGDEADRPGYDLVVQGESGLMSINGEAGRPPVKFGVAVVDMFTGMFAAQAMLAALFRAQKTGQGQRIDLALFDCGLSLSAYYGLDALISDRDPPRYGNNHPSVLPYGVYEAADGPVVLAFGNNRQFRLACEEVLERPDMAADPRFATNQLRMANREALMAEFLPTVARFPRDQLLAQLSAIGVPCGEVLGLHAAMTGARAEKTGLLHRARTHGAPFLGAPWRLDGRRCPAEEPPVLGEHTEAVLARGWAAADRSG